MAAKLHHQWKIVGLELRGVGEAPLARSQDDGAS